MDNFEFDTFLQEYLKNTLSEVNFKYVMETINNINFLNNVSGLPYIDIENIENELMTTINVDEESSGSNIGMILLNKFSELIKRELYKYGITIDIESTKSHVLAYHCVNTLKTIYDLDTELLEEIKFIIEDTDIEYSETFSRLCAIYNGVSETTLIENILSVDISFFDDLKKYISTKENILNKDTDMTVLEQLATLDGKYRKTGIYNKLYREGYGEIGINNYLDDMYSFLETYGLNIEKIAYEVSATLYIANDTRFNLFDSLDVYFNIDSLDLINKNVNISEVSDEISNYINKLLTELEARI